MKRTESKGQLNLLIQMNGVTLWKGITPTKVRKQVSKNKERKQTRKKKMSNETLNPLAVAQAAGADALAQILGGGGGFIPGIKLCHPVSKAARFKKIQEGMFFLSDKEEQKCIQIGTLTEKAPGEFEGEFTAIMGPYRYHAINIVGGDTVASESFNPSDPIFKEIQAKHKTAEDTKDCVYSYGVDVMFFIPPDQFKFETLVNKEHEAAAREQLKDGLIGIYFFCRTARQYAPAGKVDPGTPIAIQSHLTPPWKGNRWWVPDVRIVLPKTDPRVAKWCNPTDGGAASPAAMKILEQSSKFNNPVVNAPEIVEAGSAMTRAR